MAETPVLRQYQDAKSRYPDALLLFRLGDFFELFFDDAVAAAPILGVTLTSRPLGRTGRAPMCGVPQHAWQGYVGKLLKAGRKVVICDQVEPAGKGLVRREVTRVLTPGTVLEEAYLEPEQSNYVAAAWVHGRQAGLAVADVTASELLLCQLPAELLGAELARWRPAELLQPPEVDLYRFDPERGRHRLREVLNIHFLGAIGAESMPLAVGAAGALLEHLQQAQLRVEQGLFRVRSYSWESTMQVDPATVRHLELDRVAALVDQAVTPLGRRQLRAWLAAPLRDAEAIELRLAAVDELIDPSLREVVRAAMRPVADLERLTARASQRLAPARELAALRSSLESIPNLMSAVSGFESLGLRKLSGEVRAQDELASLLRRALLDDPSPTGVGSVRPGFDAELDRIRDASRDSREWIAGLEARERERTGIKALKVGFNRVFGYYLEVSSANAEHVPDDYVRKQTLTNAERYYTPELKEREALVLNAEHEMSLREQAVVRELQDRVAAIAPSVLATAHAVGELDALASFAEVAARLGWTRPEVHAGRALEIVGGRHPLVEAALPAGVFVPNDLALDSADEQIVILTGPNMAGKSTYLRQNALIVLLAQAGCFVPAERASIGIADRVFTRVGAHDDLAGGSSTFMVEMTETANILNHAGPESLLILDEVGRGTSTYDGLSIAQAVVEHIHDRLGARTLFATHYHELTSLAESLSRVRNSRVEVIEEGGEVHFLHRVVPGGADRSYGIHVAALAGLPGGVIQRARQLLEQLEAHRPLEAPAQQLALALDVPDTVRTELVELDVNRMSPLEALQKLHELQSRL